MAEHGPLTVPMKVISFGLCRTGTQTIADTLEMLGYGRIYHQREVIKNGHIDFWTDALNAHNVGDIKKLPTRADFDLILGNFQGACDRPAALLVTELLDAYPEAQVMLTTRDVDKWVFSMKSTLLHSRTVAGRESRGTEGLRDAVDVNWNHDFNANGAAFFLAHNQKVRDEAAKRSRPLLELDVSQPGSFARMCKFLGKEMPDGLTEFPHSDEWLAYKKKHGTGGYEKEASAE